MKREHTKNTCTCNHWGCPRSKLSCTVAGGAAGWGWGGFSRHWFPAKHSPTDRHCHRHNLLVLSFWYVRTPSDLPIGMLVFASAISRTLAPSGFDQGVCKLITSGMIGNADGCSPLFAQNIHPPSGWMQPRQNLVNQGQYCFPLLSDQHRGGSHSLCDYCGKHLCFFFFVKHNTFLIRVTRFFPPISKEPHLRMSHWNIPS